jgi:hypothetical protein
VQGLRISDEFLALCFLVGAEGTGEKQELQDNFHER